MAVVDSMRRAKPDSEYSRRGLSLVEIAIVLGIIGVVVGGVWSMATQGWEQSHREQAVEALDGIVRATRSFYLGQAGVPANATYKQITEDLLKNHAIPGNLSRNPKDCNVGMTCVADTPWGGFEGNKVSADGTLRVCGWELGNADDPCNSGTSYGATTQFFGVAFFGLNVGSCVALVAKASSTMGPLGLIEVNINGCNLSTGTGGCAMGAVAIQSDDKAKNLNAECGKTNPAHVTFVYRVTLPTN